MENQEFTQGKSTLELLREKAAFELKKKQEEKDAQKLNAEKKNQEQVVENLTNDLLLKNEKHVTIIDDFKNAQELYESCKVETEEIRTIIDGDKAQARKNNPEYTDEEIESAFTDLEELYTTKSGELVGLFDDYEFKKVVKEDSEHAIKELEVVIKKEEAKLLEMSSLEIPEVEVPTESEFQRNLRIAQENIEKEKKEQKQQEEERVNQELAPIRAEIADIKDDIQMLKDILEKGDIADTSEEKKINEEKLLAEEKLFNFFGGKKDALSQIGINSVEELISHADIPEVYDYNNVINTIENQNKSNEVFLKFIENLDVKTDDTKTMQEIKEKIKLEIVKKEKALRDLQIKTPEGKLEVIEKVSQEIEKKLPNITYSTAKDSGFTGVDQKQEYISVGNVDYKITISGIEGIQNMRLLPESYTSFVATYGSEITQESLNNALHQKITNAIDEKYKKSFDYESALSAIETSNKENERLAYQAEESLNKEISIWNGDLLRANIEEKLKNYEGGKEDQEEYIMNRIKKLRDFIINKLAIRPEFIKDKARYSSYMPNYKNLTVYYNECKSLLAHLKEFIEKAEPMNTYDEVEKFVNSKQEESLLYYNSEIEKILKNQDTYNFAGNNIQLYKDIPGSLKNENRTFEQLLEYKNKEDVEKTNKSEIIETQLQKVIKKNEITTEISMRIKQIQIEKPKFYISNNPLDIIRNHQEWIKNTETFSKFKANMNLKIPNIPEDTTGYIDTDNYEYLFTNFNAEYNKIEQERKTINNNINDFNNELLRNSRRETKLFGFSEKDRAKEKIRIEKEMETLNEQLRENSQKSNQYNDRKKSLSAILPNSDLENAQSILRLVKESKLVSYSHSEPITKNINNIIAAAEVVLSNQKVDNQLLELAQKYQQIA